MDLSGLDEASARQVLATAFAGVGQGQVTVTADSTTTPITYESLGRHVDIDELINDALQLWKNAKLLRAEKCRGEIMECDCAVKVAHELLPFL